MLWRLLFHMCASYRSHLTRPCFLLNQVSLRSHHVPQTKTALVRPFPLHPPALPLHPLPTAHLVGEELQIFEGAVPRSHEIIYRHLFAFFAPALCIFVRSSGYWLPPNSNSCIKGSICNPGVGLHFQCMDVMGWSFISVHMEHLGLDVIISSRFIILSVILLYRYFHLTAVPFSCQAHT